MELYFRRAKAMELAFGESDFHPVCGLRKSPISIIENPVSGH